MGWLLVLLLWVSDASCKDGHMALAYLLASLVLISCASLGYDELFDNCLMLFPDRLGGGTRDGTLIG